MKDLLIADHHEIDAILERLFSAFDKDDSEEVRRLLDFFWARLAIHIRAEHLHLFPAILKSKRIQEQFELDNSKSSVEFIENSILNLHNDHDFFMRELGSAVKQMFDLKDDSQSEQSKKLSALRERIESLNRRLELHNEDEESNVYQWAESLDAAEIPALTVKIQRELENLPPRFRKTENQM